MLKLETILLTLNMEGDENITAVLYGINDLRLEKRFIPEPKDHEVLLKMAVVGVCQSDVHFFSHGRISQLSLDQPMVTGHEGSGTVIKVGQRVKHLKPGDRVAIEPVLICHNCDYCRKGRSNLCEKLVFCSAPPNDGILAQYYAHPAEFCFKLPKNLSLVEGVMLEPLAVGIHACRRGNIGPSDFVLIIGAGPIGLLTLLSAKSIGACKIIIIDLIQSRLNKALELGADHTVLVDPKAPDDCTTKKIIDVLGDQPTKTIDCVGLEVTSRVAVEATKSGGVVVIVGLGQADVSFPISHVLLREVEVRGSLRYINDYSTALELIESGKANVTSLITHHFNIEDTVDAFEHARSRKEIAIKVLIHAHTDSNDSVI